MLVGLCGQDGCRASELKNAGLFMIFRFFLFFFLAGGNSLLHVPRTLPGCEIQLQIRYLGCGLCHLWASYFEEDLWCYCKSANQDWITLFLSPCVIHLFSFVVQICWLRKQWLGIANYSQRLSERFPLPWTPGASVASAKPLLVCSSGFTRRRL